MDSPAGPRARLFLHGRAAWRRRELALLRRASGPRAADDERSRPLHRVPSASAQSPHDDLRGSRRIDRGSQLHGPRAYRAMMSAAALLAIVVGGVWLTESLRYRRAIAPSNITRAFCAFASRSPANAGSNPAGQIAWRRSATDAAQLLTAARHPDQRRFERSERLIERRIDVRRS